jgi:SAM-dependent methyltransferase
MTWSDGYFTDLDYTYGYYRELNPAMLRLACIAANLRPPEIDDCTYLELGFGQGVSIAVHAAAATGDYGGIDFNPAQAAHAQTLADAAGSDPHLSDESFAAFAARDDLPVFDFIVLHGVWSWISAENRNYIRDIVRRRLRPGGLVYLSYNCQPGWAAQAPLRHLMAQHIEYAASRSTDAAGRIDGALAFARDLNAAGARYFADNPAVDPFLKNISGSSRNYLAHEYLNADWHIGYFADIAGELAEAKLSYAASARLLDHIPDYSLRPGDAQLLAKIVNPLMRETVRDYLVNQKFRMDMFVKGPLPINGVDARALWLETSFVLVLPVQTVKYRHATPMGDLGLDERIYRPLVEYLGEDGYRAKTMAEIGEAAALARFDIREILSALMMLTGLGIAQPARAAGEPSRRQSAALNRHLCRQALSSGDIQVLASPVLGGGKAVPQEHQLVVLAMMDGMRTPDEQAIYLDSVFQAHALTLRREGRALQPGAEAIGEFRAIAAKFDSDGHAALLKGLEVLPDISAVPAATRQMLAARA